MKAAQPARAALPLRPEQASAPAEPVRERITVSDATIEKAAKIMSQSGRALLMLRDELAGWLGVMGRYDSGGDLGFVLEAYGGRAYDVDRKSLSTPLLAGSLRIGVLGSIQPVRMDRYLLMPEDDDLLPRCLVAYPDPVPIARPKKQIDNAYLKRALIRLFALPSPASAERPDQTGVGDFHGRQPQRRWTTFAGSAANARHR